jgi:hypothetical protein
MRRLAMIGLGLTVAAPFTSTLRAQANQLPMAHGERGNSIVPLDSLAALSRVLPFQPGERSNQPRMRIVSPVPQLDCPMPVVPLDSQKDYAARTLPERSVPERMPTSPSPCRNSLALRGVVPLRPKAP